MPTKIEWTDETWNPVTGCTKVSTGCKNCYALRDWGRLSRNASTVYFGRAFTDVATHPERLQVPSRWGRPRRIFVNSMSDLFHEKVSDAYILEIMEVIRANPRHVFQILTKRAERMCIFFMQYGPPPANAHLGVSAEDQMSWDERIPWLLRTPASTHFVSCEPLLGIIDGRGRVESRTDAQVVSVPPLAEWPIDQLDWVIVGGESGPDARPTHPKWVRWLREQCEIADTPFFFKQWGEWLPEGQVRFGVTVPGRPAPFDWQDGQKAWRVGKRHAGRMLDGKFHDGQAR